MKPTLMLAAFPTALSAVAFAVNGDPMRESWSAVLGGPDLDDVKAMAVDARGNAYILANSFTSGSSGPTSWFLARLSAEGDLLWSRRFGAGDAKSQSAQALALEMAEEPIVAGLVTTQTNTVLVTVKYSAAGLALWTNSFSGTGTTNVDGVRLATHGQNALLAVQLATVDEYSDIVIRQLDQFGIQRRQGNFHGRHYLSDLRLDQHGNAFVSAHAYSYPSPSEGATAKFDLNGALEWTVPEHGALALDRDGNLFVASKFGATKFDPSGRKLWSGEYRGPAGLDRVKHIEVDVNGNVLLSGTSAGYGDLEGYGDDFLVAKLDPDGRLLWVARFDVSRSRDDVEGMALDTRGNSYVFGYPAVLAKFDVNGFRVWSTRTDFQPSIAVNQNDLLVADSRGRTNFGDIRVRKFVPRPVEGLPTIELGPQYPRAPYRSNVVFTVRTSGQQPLTNQWHFSSAPRGAPPRPAALTDDTLIVPAYERTVGEYWVEAANGLGTVASPVTRLEVEPRLRVNTYSGRPKLDVIGNFTFEYALQSSVDLRHWVESRKFVPHLGVWSVSFDSLGWTNSALRFFRAVELAP